MIVQTVAAVVMLVLSFAALLLMAAMFAALVLAAGRQSDHNLPAKVGTHAAPAAVDDLRPAASP